MEFFGRPSQLGYPQRKPLLERIGKRSLGLSREPRELVPGLKTDRKGTFREARSLALREFALGVEARTDSSSGSPCAK
jgi:hypothetical protein